MPGEILSPIPPEVYQDYNWIQPKKASSDPRRISSPSSRRLCGSNRYACSSRWRWKGYLLRMESRLRKASNSKTPQRVYHILRASLRIRTGNKEGEKGYTEADHRIRGIHGACHRSPSRLSHIEKRKISRPPHNEEPTDFLHKRTAPGEFRSREGPFGFVPAIETIGALLLTAHLNSPETLGPFIIMGKGQCQWTCILSFRSGGITASTGFRGMVVAMRRCLNILLATR